MGTMLEVFQSKGTRRLRDKLKKHSYCWSNAGCSVSIPPDISSGPFDLVTSSDESRSKVLSSVQRSLVNASSGRISMLTTGD